MITINLPTWTPIGGLTLVDTSYQVASDINFTPASILDNHLNDTVNLDTYLSPVVVPVNTTYYVRVNRTFSNGSTSGWGAPMAVTNRTANGGMVAYSPVVVHQPVVTVDPTLNDRISNTYTVRTTAFVGVNEAHGYTIFIVEDEIGDIIEYVKTGPGVTTYTFNKGPNLMLGHKYLRFVAIHGTLSGIESPPGEAVYDLTTAEFSLSVGSLTKAPGGDVTVTFTYAQFGNNNTISTLDLTDLNGTPLWSTPIQPGATSAIIPGALLQGDTQYLITATGPSATGAPVSKTIPMDIVPLNNVNYLNKLHVYNRSVSVGNYGPYPTPTEILSTKELFNGKFIEITSGATLGSGALAETYITPNRQYVQGSPYTGLTLVNGVLALHTDFLPNDQAILYRTVNGLTYATLYNMDFYNNAVTPVGNSLTMPSTYLDTSVHVVANNRIYSGQHVAGKVSVTDITPLGLVPVPTADIALPTGASSVACLLKGQGNTLLYIANYGTVIKSIDLDTNTVTDKFVVPMSFRGRTLRAAELLNGDYVIWKPIRTEVVGVSQTDTVLELLYIDNTNSTMTMITPYTNRLGNIVVSVLRNSGELLLIENYAGNVNTLVFQ